MENVEYYQALAERIFFRGMKSGEVSEFAMYRPEKKFQDLGQAISQGRLEGIGQFEREIGCIARRLYEVLEINPDAFDKVYGKPDRW